MTENTINQNSTANIIRKVKKQRIIAITQFFISMLHIILLFVIMLILLKKVIDSATTNNFVDTITNDISGFFSGMTGFLFISFGVLAILWFALWIAGIVNAAQINSVTHTATVLVIFAIFPLFFVHWIIATIEVNRYNSDHPNAQTQNNNVNNQKPHVQTQNNNANTENKPNVQAQNNDIKPQSHQNNNANTENKPTPQPQNNNSSNTNTKSLEEQKKQLKEDFMNDKITSDQYKDSLSKLGDKPQNHNDNVQPQNHNENNTKSQSLEEQKKQLKEDFMNDKITHDQYKEFLSKLDNDQ